MAFIEFRDIHKYFGEAHVLKGINLDIEEGEFVTLLGPSGCGKSTLLRCFSGLESVTEGEIYLAGTNITNFTPKQRKISMVFQQYSLFPNMTVGQNVAFGLQMQKKKKNYIQEKVKETLDIVGLSEKIDQYPRELSGGQQQRVALARAIIVEPRVLLLDEPLSAIDALLRRNLQVEIRKIQQKLKITTIFVTHDQEEAMVMSDTIHLFNLGKIEQSGTPREIYSHPKSKFAASFIGRYNIIKSEEMKKRTPFLAESDQIAFRPEAVRLSLTADETADEMYHMKGTVRHIMSRGTTVMYTIDCAGMEIEVDRLFSTTDRIRLGDEVYLAILKEDVLPLL